MKCNYRRTVEKHREEVHQAKLKARQEKLDAMTPEEREQFLKEEHKRAQEALATMALAQSMIGDSPYSKI